MNIMDVQLFLHSKGDLKVAVESTTSVHLILLHSLNFSFSHTTLIFPVAPIQTAGKHIAPIIRWPLVFHRKQ